MPEHEVPAPLPPDGTTLCGTVERLNTEPYRLLGRILEPARTIAVRIADGHGAFGGKVLPVPMRADMDGLAVGASVVLLWSRDGRRSSWDIRRTTGPVGPQP